jgi:predicted nuclease with RNAse H fold
MKVAGIDLAGLAKNPTGICVLAKEVKLYTVYQEEEIVNLVKDCKLIAVDAPLCLTPKPEIRQADRILKRFGALPPNLPSMQALSKRGKRLSETLKQLGEEVIEVFPTATAKILSIYSKDYKLMAKKLGIKAKNSHEADAYLAALTARLFLLKKAKAIGDKDGKIVIPLSKDIKWR